MLQWFIPFERNMDQTALKLFARLGLAVSKTVKTVCFKPCQIFRSDDAYAGDERPRRINLQRSQAKKASAGQNSASTSMVMNDGCARISPAAARAVADQLHLDYVPCAFQARIAGAKGVWMVDVNETSPFPHAGDFWIEITDSQVKFDGHTSDLLFPDEGRTTFEVNDYVQRLRPSSLNFQLIPILQHCGVPTEVFEHILREDLTTKVSHLQASMTDPLALRLWNQRNNSEQQSHVDDMQGGLPRSTQAKIAWFVDRGFEPKDCQFMKELLRKAAHCYCDRLQDKLDVAIGQSAFPFMIADPTGTLDDNEVHFCFSSSFVDSKSGFDDTMLHNQNVLVARSPAHLPSHIQRVRAVFKPELRAYRDVIVFSSKGPRPLANLLSGGDYDGDKAWVCWDPRLVEPFVNHAPRPEPAPEVFGITKDRTETQDVYSPAQRMHAFISHGFDFNVRFKQLGSCSNYFEQLCYSGYSIDDDKVVELGMLLGLLVDSAKGGFIFDEAAWQAYLKQRGLPKPFMLSKPAYRERKNQKPTKHIIDLLVFGVAKVIVQETLVSFSKQFPDTSTYDEDLQAIHKTEEEEGKSNPELKSVLDNLTTDLRKIHSIWAKNCQSQDSEVWSFGPTKPNNTGMSFSELVEHCRQSFVDLSPRLDHDTQSDRIREWQAQHDKKQRSSWDRIKASYAFKINNKTGFVWYTAGIELGEIKAMAPGYMNFEVVRSRFHKALKPDSKYIEGVKRREDFEAIVAAFSDDSDDEENEDFGSWSWADDAL